MLTNLNPPVPNYASPGGPVSIRNNQRMATDLQVELAEYGLAYEGAKQGVAKQPKGTNHFGLKKYGNEYNLYFPDSVLELGSVQGAQLASLKPEGTGTFDMLKSSQAFGKELSAKDPKTIRNYLRKLVESC